jgi:tetratricopeptide (TPR) repeat protein
MPRTVKFDYDVFISYSTADEVWVRDALLAGVEKPGLRACIAFRDFRRGAPGIKEMQRAVKKSRKTLAVLTPNYVKSGWAEIEYSMAQTLTPANRDLRLLPLLRAKCKMPLSLKTLTHIDFTDGADLDLAWRQLLTALGTPPEQPPPELPKRDHWFLAHPYPMPPNFTGRLAERAMLTSWLASDASHPLLVLRALGGFGKSALVWHWMMHDVDPKTWPRVVWWSFYEGDPSFDNFLTHAVDDLSSRLHSLSAREHLDRLLKLMQQPGRLVVLDGFERTLRAFGGLDAAYRGDEPVTESSDRDCISPLAEAFLRNVSLLPGIQAKVLLTTRLTPGVLEARGGCLLLGARREELGQLAPADAVDLFRAQGIRGTRTEIEQMCAPCGYHPLSLRLLAGLIVGDFQRPGDIAAATRLDVSKDLVQHQHHVLEAAYDALAPVRRTLLSRIACFRSPVNYEALRALAETTTSGSGLDADLRDLVGRGLLHHDTKKCRFDLHPIVRRYTYDRLSEPDRIEVHTRLRDYFAGAPGPDTVTSLDDLATTIELFHHTVRAGQYDAAYQLFHDRIHGATYYQFGGYQLQIDLLRGLFPNGEDHPPRLNDGNAQAWVLNSLANSYRLTGLPRRGVPLFELQLAILEKQGEKGDLARGLRYLAGRRRDLGELRAAEARLHRLIALSRTIEDTFNEAIGHQGLGRVLAYVGNWDESAAELTTALAMHETEGHLQLQGVTWAYRALLALLSIRDRSRASTDARQWALESARRALELAGEAATGGSPCERNFVEAHSLLGAAHLATGQHEQAERYLAEAMDRCRRISLVNDEAGILIELARLRAANNSLDEARRLAAEALVITERCGYVLQGADARLELAKLALAGGDKATALEHANEARRLATCDGPPDYTYKVAYDEAGALLEQLK